jgi:hypothetical protein
MLHQYAPDRITDIFEYTSMAGPDRPAATNNENTSPRQGKACTLWRFQNK